LQNFIYRYTILLAKEVHMARKKSSFTQKDKIKCVMCRSENPGSILCKGCTKRIEESGHNPALYCQLCDRISSIVADRRLTTGAQTSDAGIVLMTLVIYDNVIGCPRCPKRPDGCIDQPHPTTYRHRIDAA
jgi:hypothetical protein